MLVASPRYRRPISSNQVSLLDLLYKFRYVSTDLVAEVLKKDRSTIYESLYVLEKQGYIYKFHDKTYRLRGRPAIYCLATEGIKYLRGYPEFDQTTLRNFYKNKQMREEHIDHCLLVFAMFNKLKALTGDKFSIYSKYELNRDHFPKPLPDLFLQKRGSSKKPDYVLDIIPTGTFTWLLRKRIQQYEDFSDQYEYLSPDVLFVAGNESTEKRLFKLLYENYADFKFCITQQSQLFESEDGKIWIDMDEADEDELNRSAIT